MTEEDNKSMLREYLRTRTRPDIDQIFEDMPRFVKQVRLPPSIPSSLNRVDPIPPTNANRCTAMVDYGNQLAIVN